MCRLNNGAWMRPTGFRPHTRAHVEERERERQRGREGGPESYRVIVKRVVAMREKGVDSFGHLSFRAGLAGARGGAGRRELPAGFA